MVTECTVRSAKPEEFDWINQRYDEVNFVHSQAGRDTVMIAETGAQAAGIARLVPVQPGVAELGGMYVFAPFRGQGIAHRLIAALLQQAHAFHTLYCLPFAQVHALYQQHGFMTVEDVSHVPQAVIKKYHWCNTFYKDPTHLLAYFPTGAKEPALFLDGQS